MLTYLCKFENIDRIWVVDSLEGTQYIYIKNYIHIVVGG